MGAPIAVLSINDINTYYGSIHALRGISLEVRQGEIVALIGGNGAGQSTTLNSISGLVRPRSGKILLNGEDLSRFQAHEIMAKGVVQVPEGRRIFARLTVNENLKMGAFVVSDKAAVAERTEQAFEMFPRLKQRQNQVAGTLSGGEQQMLAMSRALMSDPKVLLMDEPSMGLAPVLVDQIFDTIRQLHERGTTILLVEQNARKALEIADRGYVIETGQIVLADRAENLRDNEMVQKAYLGID
ncbi:MAG: ABC transporter ATP-binding protein [Candidatus Limnocylindrales bacterium]|nr:ABC transporter ATP-binding protein [Candidatus Limnocylindrales bacterium]